MKKVQIFALAAASCAMLMSAGCGRRAARQHAVLQQHATQALLRRAAQDTGCHPSQMASTQLTDGPPVFLVSGCGQSLAYWGECGGRRGACRWSPVPPLAQQASAALQCPAQQIQAQPTQQPAMQNATGCGRMMAFTMTCNGAACGWAPSGPVQGAGGGMVAGGRPPIAQAPVGPPARLQAQVQTQRDAIMSCIDVTNISLTLRWTAEGQVVLSLPAELMGTGAEGCIQAAVGTLSVVTQQAGQTVVSLQ